MSETDQKNRDRLDAEAAKWAHSMLFTEPLKVIAAAYAGAWQVGLMLTAVCLSQLLGYCYLAGQVGRHAGHGGIRWLEALRHTAVLAYAFYADLFFWYFVLRPLGVA
ncbi:hypothetical protein [Sabulicella rubraurantiaca]|uniref:hypothetical protein n=1 Tax=Sabulicella rubraurantiaca TaxID=2811429 RepID=UPI001A977E98|nr:hypothetical protein [Sabulicella rubraurantiaca]